MALLCSLCDEESQSVPPEIELLVRYGAAWICEKCMIRHQIKAGPVEDDSIVNLIKSDGVA